MIDSFGYISSATYDLFYGQTLVSSDINQNSIEYTYDNFGRTQTIVAPYQTGTELYTIQFEYHPDDEVPWALSKHIDVYRDVNDPIETVLFTDGLKRVIQTKKDATLHTSPTSQSEEGMIVSGHLTVDFVGRTIEQYYPITEELGNQGLFNPGIDPITPTLTTYDVLDRNLTTTIPDNTTTTISYGFGTDRNAQPQFLTEVTDANGISKKSYRDVRGLITAVKEFNNDGAEVIWTSYQYDPLNQIALVIDDHYNVTSVSYDNLGRRTAIESPDMGFGDGKVDFKSNRQGIPPVPYIPVHRGFFY